MPISTTWLFAADLAPLALKHELAEVALVEPPPELARLAVTVMDGPFFSSMPYPAEKLYSLAHVRYTPHFSWVDSSKDLSPYQINDRLPKVSRWRHMVQDAKRFLPCMQDVTYRHSLFDVKTVLVRNERDDGRPILLHRHSEGPRIYSVMGAKIDNIYDLFEALPQIDKLWRDAHAGLASRMRANMISGPSLQTARYGAVILLGFGVDFGITLALSRLVGLPLELSAAVGFLGALALNYILFEFWVFRREDSTFSAPRLLQTVLAAGAALSVRVGVIWLVRKDSR